MQRPGVVTNDDWTEAQGLVWYSTRRGGTVLLGHDGSLNGFSTSIRFSVRDGIGAIALLNGVGPASDLAFDLASAFMSQRVPTPPERARRRPIPEAWRDLPGTYADLEFGDEARVEWRGNELVIQSEDAFRRLEETEDPLTFVVRGGRSSGEPVVFERGEAGVRGLRLLTYPYVKLS
jgi:hypothetical protein